MKAESTLSLSQSKGPVSNTVCQPWVVSWAELGEQLSRPKVRVKKDGPYFVIGALANNKRSNENMTNIEGVVIDGDATLNEDGTKTDGAPCPRDVEQAMLETGWPFLIYTSHSHIKKGNRWRLFVPVHGAFADDVAPLVEHILSLLRSLGVMVADATENTSKSQPWFLPAVPTAKAIEDYWFCQHTGTRDVDVDAARKAFNQSSTKKKGSSNESHNNDSVIGKFNAAHGFQWIVSTLQAAGYTVPKEKTSSKANGADTQRLLPPGSTTGIAGTSVYSDKKGEARVTSWNDSCPIHNDKGWDSWDVNVHFNYAGDNKRAWAQWSSELDIADAAQIAGDFDAENDDVDDVNDVADEFDIEEDASKAQLARAIIEERVSVGQAREHKLIRKGAVAKAFESGDAERAEKVVGAYRKQQLSAFNYLYGLANYNGKSAVISLEKGPKGFQETQFQQPNDVRLLFQNRHVPKIKAKGNDTVLVWDKLFESWLNWGDRRTYRRVEFSPAPNLVVRSKLPDGNSYNLYTGATFKPVQGDWTLIRRHIYEVWCDGDKSRYNYVIGWLARMVQKPNEQGQAILCLHSIEGTGKGVITTIFERYYGNHGLALSSLHDLMGFNDHLGSCVFLNLNEVIFGGDKRLVGTIKMLATDPYLTVEKKFLPKFTIRNCNHIITSSNEDWFAAISRTDRRHVVLEVSPCKVGDRKYFKELTKHIAQDGGQEAFIHYLLNEHDISSFDPAVLPASSSVKVQQQIRGLAPVEKFWMDILKSGDCRNPYPKTDEFYNPRVSLEGEIEKTTIYDAFVASRRDGHSNETAVTFWNAIYTMMGGKPREINKRDADKRVRCLDMPPLEECRKAFADYLNTDAGNINWDDENAADELPARV